MSNYQPAYAHLDALLVDMQDATRPSDIPESPAFQAIIREAREEAVKQALIEVETNGPIY